MTWEHLCSVLTALGVDTSHLVPSSNGRVMVPCPLASHFHSGGEDTRPSLCIWYDETPVRWKCYACHEKGRLWELAQSYADLNDSESVRRLATQLVDEDKLSCAQQVEARVRRVMDADKWFRAAEPSGASLAEDAIERYPPVWESARAVRYLRTRVSYRETIDRFDLRYDSDRDRVVFPVRRPDGTLAGAVGRVCVKELDAGVLPYLNYYGFQGVTCLGGANHMEAASSIIVVEGFCDMLRIDKWARDRSAAVVCTWTSQLSAEHAHQLVARNLRVSIWYDNDDAGNKGYYEARKRLSGRVARITRGVLQYKSDPGDLTEGQFDRVYSNAMRCL